MATAKDLGLDSLEGWQCMKTGFVQKGDLRVSKWPNDMWWADEAIDWTVQEDMPHILTYRRIPAANHKDVADERTKALIAESMPFVVEGTSLNVVPQKAATHDEGKPGLAYLPWKGLREVALVQAYGQQKYGDWFNYKKGMEVGRNASCAMRHIADYMDGIDLDHESKRKHIAHAACRLLFILENEADGTAIDDRHKK